MNNYIVFEKSECDCVYALQSGDYYGPDICPMCENKRYIMSEVSLSAALIDLIIQDYRVGIALDARTRMR